MIRILQGVLIACICISSGLSVAQTIHEDYQDGKIWIRVDHRSIYPLTHGTSVDKISPSVFPFLGNLSDFGITSISRPFSAAKGNLALQNTYLLEFTAYHRADELVRSLNNVTEVMYAEKVPLDRIFHTPNDPSFSSQWALAKVNAQQAWDITLGGTAIKLAVVDDGVQLNHPDLQLNIWANPEEIPNNGVDDDQNGYVDDYNGYDVADNDNNPSPPNNNFFHGTEVAGVVSGRSNNGAGIASLAYRSKIISVRVSKFPGVITHGYEGILYAANAGAHVINVSWGGPVGTTTGQNIIDYAYNKGSIIVAAAGNSGTSAQMYPAAYSNVLSVASTNSADKKSPTSGYGNWVFVSAPGD